MTTSTHATHIHEERRAPLVLNSISILRAPGISPGFTLDDLSPQITIVFGPNASGKSTTARAIQSVLWPHQSALRGYHLAASFTLDGERWNIEASAATVYRTRNDEPAEAPLIAPLDDRARYSLGLPDLLASENQPLAQAILNESSGGFNLPQVAESLGFDGTVPPRLEAANNVQTAHAALRQVTSIEEETREALSSRGQLHARRLQSREAAREIANIDTALDYQRRLAEEADVGREIEQFPDAVKALTGNEPQQIADLTSTIAQHSAKLEQATRVRDRWQTLAEETGIARATNPVDHLKSLRIINQQQQEIGALLADADREVATAISERTAHQQRLASDLDDDQIAALDADGMREFADIAAAYETIRSRRTARDEVEIWLGGVQAPQNLDALQQGVETLQTRLQYPNAAEQREISGMPRLIGIGGGVLLAAAGAVLAISVDPLWWILTAVGVLLVLLAWKYTSSASPKIAAELEQTYGALPLPQPEAWRAHHIRDLLGQLREELKVALVEQEKADRWQDLEQERIELDEAYAETESRREAAIRKYGVAPDLKEESLRLLADNLGRWQAADATVRGVQARQIRLQADKSTLQARSRTILNGLGFDEGDLTQQIDDLERRIEALNHARENHDSAQQEIDESLQPMLDAAISRRNAIYQHFGLDPDDASGMHRLQEQRSQLVAVQQRLAEHKSAVQDAWESLSLTPHLREMTVAELTSARDAAQQIASQQAEVETQLQELNSLEQSAIRAHDRETAQSALDDARIALTKERNRIMERSVGDLLLTTVQQETRDAALPLVFHRARELFGIITRGKYELQFEVGPPPEFTALDTSTCTTLSLDQLSSGTRVQLLMAIRLAFVENVEVGPKLPVILDETLGNSDEFRASAIIDAAIDISRQGRQVFYFTAQGDEVARWIQRVESMPEGESVEIKIVELAQVRREAGFERLPIPATSTVERTALPSPADYDPETWAVAMRIPSVDPWASSHGSTHLWHVVPDTDVLYALLREDIVTLGQLESLERTNPERLDAIHPGLQQLLSGIQVRANLLNDAVHMWRIGRARPMPAGILADADMVDAFILQEMQLLQTDAENDGQTLLETLQTMDDPPMAEKPLEALELWMISEGFIAQGAPMSERDIRARVIELASPAIRSGHLEVADVDKLMMQVQSW